MKVTRTAKMSETPIIVDCYEDRELKGTSLLTQSVTLVLTVIGVNRTVI